MKRALHIVITICLLLSALTTVSFANSSTYILREPGMSMEISNDFVVFTRDMDANDPILAEHGLTKDYIETFMLAGDIYLNAWDSDISHEIIVTMTESTLDDYHLLSDTMLTSLFTSFPEELATSGITLLDANLYQHKQAKFYKMYFSKPNDGATSYGLQYHTVYDGKAIYITMHSYNSDIDENDETVLKRIVDDIHFTAPPRKVKTMLPTQSFVYEDPTSGITFTVPKEWIQEPMGEDQDTFDVEFSSNLEKGLSIHFSCDDFWSLLSENEKKQVTRSEIDNSLFSKEEIAELFGCPVQNVSTVVFCGRQYYQASFSDSFSEYGFTSSINHTYLLRVENGYIYKFLFSGDTDHPLYSDFKDLMNSISYPEIEKSTPKPQSTNNQNDAHFWVVKYLISLVVTICIYSVPMLIYRYAIEKKPVEKKKAKRITVIYGIVAFICVTIYVFFTSGSFITIGATLFWSGINYRILTGRKS